MATKKARRSFNSDDAHTKCRQLCPQCGVQCLGCKGHSKTVEHQCAHHFWISGALVDSTMRLALRAVWRALWQQRVPKP